MNSILKSAWVNFVSKCVWLNEDIFFFPKLSAFYRSQSVAVKNIFDVGANRGQSVKFYRSIFPECKIYAFEPLIKPFNLLKKKWRSKDVSVFNLGLGEKTECKTFYECVFDEVSSFKKPDIKSKYFLKKSIMLFSRPSKMFRELTVKSVSLDEFFSGLYVDRIDILKIDVEGYELEVLKGARKTLQSGRVFFVQLEVHEDDQYQVSYEEVKDFLFECGYELSVEIKHGFGHFKDVVFSLKNKGGFFNEQCN